MNKSEAREQVDTALFNWMVTLGYSAHDVDYSAINEVLDDVEAYAEILVKQ